MMTRIMWKRIKKKIESNEKIIAIIDSLHFDDPKSMEYLKQLMTRGYIHVGTKNPVGDCFKLTEFTVNLEQKPVF